MTIYADRLLTPGASDPAITAGQVCVRGFATRRRPTRWQSLKLKGQAMKRYGIPRTPAGWHGVVLDHLIPLELGGAPLDIQNVWPQPRTESHLKDQDENFKKRQVCARATTLQAAQEFFQTTWTR